MNHAIVSYAHNSQAICNPFIELSLLPGNDEQIMGGIEASISCLLEQVVFPQDAIRERRTSTQCMEPRRSTRTAQETKNKAAIQLLESWRHGDEQEQRETWEYLERALNEDRLSDRRLFP